MNTPHGRRDLAVNDDDGPGEDEQSSHIDRFALQAAPIWFTWLEWVLVLGAFDYLAAKSGSWLTRVAAAVTLGLLWMYFNSFFRRLHCKRWFGIHKPGGERAISSIASAVVAACFWFAAQGIAETIAANTK